MPLRRQRQMCIRDRIDLYKYAVPYDSIDGTHPNKGGMSTLADLILREMLGENNA